MPEDKRVTSAQEEGLVATRLTLPSDWDVERLYSDQKGELLLYQRALSTYRVQGYHPLCRAQPGILLYAPEPACTRE